MDNFFDSVVFSIRGIRITPNVLWWSVFIPLTVTLLVMIGLAFLPGNEVFIVGSLVTASVWMMILGIRI